jgi:hypothetical protein
MFYYTIYAIVVLLSKYIAGVVVWWASFAGRICCNVNYYSWICCGAQFPCPGGTKSCMILGQEVMHDLWIRTTVKHAMVPIFQLQ